MLILVDGYNVVMADPALEGRSKESQRDALIERVRRITPAVHGRSAKPVVVFDARGSWGRTSEVLGSVKAVYARDADDEIVRRCAESRGQIVVYTNDMRLRARISQDVGRMVEYRDVSALFVTSPTRHARIADVPLGGTPDRDEVPPSDARDITAELARHWLDEEEE